MPKAEVKKRRAHAMFLTLRFFDFDDRFCKRNVSNKYFYIFIK